MSKTRTETQPAQGRKKGYTRRKFVKTVGVSAAAVVFAPAVLRHGTAYAAGRTIRIGHVSPKTGPVAAFAEADDFIEQGIRKAVGKGIRIGGTVHPIEIITKDSQSNPNRAAEVAAKLILSDKIDLMVAAGTPDNVNPVSDQCELNEVPCISTNAPWQAYFFGRGGKPPTGFEWTYHFFWGLEDVIGAFTNMWNTLDTNRVVGGMFSNDVDGNAWGDPKHGMPAALKPLGFKLIDPGRYQPLSEDYTAQIFAFKKAKVEILTGV
ncbi:MAG: ABC transporter substrate-binding protein, partial [bacterium]